MSEVIDLWPEFTPEKVRSPKTILKEQADLLAQKTNNVLKADLTIYYPLKTLLANGAVGTLNKSLGVPIVGQEHIIGLTFDIIAPYLDNYKYHLFKVEYEATTFYPLKINDRECINEAEFLNELQTLLHDGKTITIIRLVVMVITS